MRRYLSLLLFIGLAFGQSGTKKFKLGMDFGGFIPDRNGAFGTLYFFDASAKINPICGIMFYNGAFGGTGKYEDYTDVFGTVNIWEDRDDGLISNSEVRGLAGVWRIFFNNKELMFNYGFASYDKSYFQALYDPLEVLGNNGYYYIESRKPRDEENGLIFGMKYNYYFNYPFNDIFFGSGIHFNTIKSLPRFLLKFDIGFVLGWYFFKWLNTSRYDLPEDGLVNITVYHMLGNVIKELVNEVQNSGYKSIQWNATNNQGQPLSAGVYLYSIEVGDFRQTKKMILLK